MHVFHNLYVLYVSVLLLTDADSIQGSKTNLTSSYALYESVKLPNENHYEMDTSMVRTSGAVFCIFKYTIGWSMAVQYSNFTTKVFLCRLGKNERNL